jgi:hypothetical protein
MLILEILNVFLWLKFSPFLNSNKNEHFSKVSFQKLNPRFSFRSGRFRSRARPQPFYRDLCKTPPFAQFPCQAQILILKILNVFLRLKFSPSLNLNKIDHFSKVSYNRRRSSATSRIAKRRERSPGPKDAVSGRKPLNGDNFHLYPLIQPFGI